MDKSAHSVGVLFGSGAYKEDALEVFEDDQCKKTLNVPQEITNSDGNVCRSEAVYKQAGSVRCVDVNV